MPGEYATRRRFLRRASTTLGALAVAGCNGFGRRFDATKLAAVTRTDGTPSGGRCPFYVRIERGEDSTGTGVCTIDDAGVDAPADMAFFPADGEGPLAYYWRRFDADAGVYEAWVRTGDLVHDGSEQVKLLYGNGQADLSTDPAAVFAAQSFHLRYGFEGDLRDATGNSNGGTHRGTALSDAGQFGGGLADGSVRAGCEYPSRSLEDDYRVMLSTFLKIGTEVPEPRIVTGEATDETGVVMGIGVGPGGEDRPSPAGSVAAVWQEPERKRFTRVLSGDTTVNDEEWHHLAVLFDRRNDHTELWVDGTSMGTDTWPENEPSTYGGNFRIGYGETHGDGTAGAIYDEWRVHDRPPSNPTGWVATEWKMSPAGGYELLRWLPAE